LSYGYKFRQINDLAEIVLLLLRLSRKVRNRNETDLCFLKRKKAMHTDEGWSAIFSSGRPIPTGWLLLAALLMLLKVECLIEKNYFFL
jgi:hypothetical protein